VTVAEMKAGRIYVNPYVGFMWLIPGARTQTAAGTFLGVRWDGIPAYLDERTEVLERTVDAVYTVRHYGQDRLQVRQVPGGWQVSRYTLRGGLVNMGHTFSDEGLIILLDWYASHAETPKWDRTLQAVIRRAGAA
jgi:hypothetical protein